LFAAIKQLGKHSIIYGLGGLVTSLLGFVLLPIYTRYLTPTDYGIFSLLLVTSSVAGIISQLGLGSALFREVIYRESDEKVVESTALYFLIFEATTFFAVLIVLSNQLSSLIFDTSRYASLLSLTFLTTLLGVFDVVTLAKLRIQGRSTLFAVLTVARFLVGFTLNVYFIMILRRGLEGLVIANLLRAALFAVASLTLLIRDLQPVFSAPILRRILSFGVPLVPFGISHLALTSADRYFLQHFSTTAEVGLYSLGYSIGMIVNLVVSAVQLAWPAQMYTIAKSADAEQQFSKILTYYLLILGFIGLGLSVLAREVLIVMTTPSFYGAYIVVPLVALSYILWGTMYMTNSALETQNRVKYMSLTIVSSAILNLGLSYLLIPTYGMMGAAWATLISYLALAVVQLLINLHFWYIPYEYGRIAKLAIACGAIYALNLLIKTSNVWLNASLKLLLLTTYPLCLYLLGFYEARELARLKLLFRTGIQRMRA
jgi:O-antigen/teichoic acid export membrane protein